MAKKSLPTSEMVDTSDKFEAMYESNAPLIYRFMFWRTKDEMLAQDLTSSVFEKAWRTRSGYSGGSTKAWLYRIARTTLIDHWRKKKDVLVDSEAMSEVASDTPRLDETLDQAMTVVKLQQAINKLPKDMRAVVGQRFISGHSVREVAKKLHISEANVRVIQYRALQKLRNYLR